MADRVEGTGTILYLDTEDEFYRIVADDGSNYGTINLSSEAS